MTASRQVVLLEAALEQAYGRAQSWYANNDHYYADFPEDHTPFSRTQWPVESDDWIVDAIDGMRGGMLTADVQDALVAYQVAEARAGRWPGLKYLIYRDRIYLTWRGFAADEYRGEYHNHAHYSFRTDYRTRGWPDGWSPIGVDVSREDVYAVLRDGDLVPTPANHGNPANKGVAVTTALTELMGRANEIRTRTLATQQALAAAEERATAAEDSERRRDEQLRLMVAALTAAVEQLAEAVREGGGEPAVVAVIDALRKESKAIQDAYQAQLGPMTEEISALRSTIRILREALAQAASAEADLLRQRMDDEAARLAQEPEPDQAQV